MNYIKVKILILILASIFITGVLSSTTAAIAFSGESKNSLSISSERSENNKNYMIEIFIKGIATSKVTFETDYQTLYLSARSGGVITHNAISGAQVVSLAFGFPADADLRSFSRVNKPNKIVITVPKT